MASLPEEEGSESAASGVPKQKRSFLCSNELDSLFYCARPRNQLSFLYREGQLDSCQDLYESWMCCLMPKRTRRVRAPPPLLDEPHVWEPKKRPQWHYGEAPEVRTDDTTSSETSDEKTTSSSRRR